MTDTAGATLHRADVEGSAVLLTVATTEARDFKKLAPLMLTLDALALGFACRTVKQFQIVLSGGVRIYFAGRLFATKRLVIHPSGLVGRVYALHRDGTPVRVSVPK